MKKRMLPLIDSSKLESKTVDGKFLRIDFEAFLYFGFWQRLVKAQSFNSFWCNIYEVGSKFLWVKLQTYVDNSSTFGFVSGNVDSSVYEQEFSEDVNGFYILSWFQIGSVFSRVVVLET